MTVTLQPIVIETLGEVLLMIAGLTPHQNYRVVILPLRNYQIRLEQEAIADDRGSLSWKQPVQWQGEALVDLFTPGGNKPLATFHLYAASRSILARRPLRCDFHMHTRYSDGRDTPAEMVLRGRELGLDALAITDHNQYQASLEAVQFVKKSGLALLCFTGEEVTSPTWHLLSIGASGPVGFERDRLGYEGLLRTIDLIHQYGGCAFLAHPYWINLDTRRINFASEEYERLLLENKLDGIELFDGVGWEDNLRSLVRYGNLNQDQKLPVLGNSDSHWLDHTIGSYWTLAFVKSLSQEDVMAAILDRHAVAIMRMAMEPPNFAIKPRLLAFGPPELVDLALFLDQYYYPVHNVLCSGESALARRFLNGDTLPQSEMHRVQEELEAHYLRNWLHPA